VGGLPVHRDQLQAQRSVPSMGELCTFLLAYLLVTWLSGSDVSHINKVAVRRARLVPKWVTVAFQLPLVLNVYVYVKPLAEWDK